jgi:hypothetical protein
VAPGHGGDRSLHRREEPLPKARVPPAPRAARPSCVSCSVAPPAKEALDGFVGGGPEGAARAPVSAQRPLLVLGCAGEEKGGGEGRSGRFSSVEVGWSKMTRGGK